MTTSTTVPTGDILITRRPPAHPGPATSASSSATSSSTDGKIAAIGTDLNADGATVIDGTDRAVLPGFVDTHRHTWQGAVRQTGIGWDFGAYRQHIQLTWGPEYTPEDVYVGNLVGASARSTPASPPCATSPTSRTAPTTPTRPSPRCRTPASAASSPTAGPPSTPTSGCCAAKPPTPRTSAGSASSSSPTTPPWSPCRRCCAARSCPPPRSAPKDLALARELGIRSSMHVGNGPWGPQFRGIGSLGEAGLLGEDLLFIHCCTSDDEELEMLADAGAPPPSPPPSKRSLPGLGAPATAPAAEVRHPAQPQHRHRSHRRRRHVQRDARRHLPAHGVGISLAPEIYADLPLSRRATCSSSPPSPAPRPPGSPTAPAASPSARTPTSS